MIVFVTQTRQVLVPPPPGARATEGNWYMAVRASHAPGQLEGKQREQRGEVEDCQKRIDMLVISF